MLPNSRDILHGEKERKRGEVKGGGGGGGDGARLFYVTDKRPGQ